MFGEAERRIMNLDNSMRMANSRISACENEIYKINNNVYSEGPIWSKITDIEYSIVQLSERLADTIANLEVLASSLQERIDAIEAEASVKSENPNQKSDLEISKQNSGYIDLDRIAEEKGIWELYDENWYNR